MTNSKCHIKELISVKYDAMLNSPVDNCKFCSYCEDENITLRNQFWFKSFCYQFARNVQTVYEIIGPTPSLKEKRCNDLIYWMYDRVINTHKQNYLSQKQWNTVGDILKVWNDINDKSEYKTYSPKCETAFDMLDFNERSQRKILDDYCENYDSFEEQLKKNTKCCNTYYDYLNNQKNIYELSLKVCPNGGTAKNYCQNLCKDKINNYKNLLETSACNSTRKEQENNNFITKQKCEEEKDLKFQEGLNSMVCDNSYLNFSDHRVIFLILSTVWGIFLTLLFLCKMSPFGSRIKNILQKKKKIQNNFDEENEHELFSNYSENLNANFSDTEYNIPYN
ncbi:PIR Superfamily Protein [Plasmodium ovale wallikeri]|uniref:PIR Superfamily Protein n=1 Tax=Plasmodium ovale wallikeri TaxID=864142 RepID=A0A1A9AS12_PLAOA|nr:PIR Superfamily Protein [Plasmodium ovale wallikeri]SBT59012.1 PIR Superfamily Protein [Plasmodium ovale wallikeri]